MTFEETMGHISDRFGRRITVMVGGRSERGPAVGVIATGTLAPGLDEQRLAVLNENVPESVIQAFSFEEAPEVRVYFDPSEFRDASVHGDRLTIHVGEDVEITFEPALDPA
jgi:hypothetical protein